MIQNIENIEINKLYQHPDNPRKIFDDEKTRELADSIKENGVMQNLTVVPFEDGFRVIIGHRRLAAAKMAGLTELPCKVVDMDYKDQIATMLSENMQRVDLTVHEQVAGIQMMLDLGESAQDIQKHTGLSKTTVYHRMKMTELDRESLRQASERGGSIEDYIKLEKIEDIKTRNLVLCSIGTNNFNNEYQKAIEAQNRKVRVKKWQEWLDSFAVEIKELTPQYQIVQYISAGYTDPPEQIPEDAGETEYFYLKGKYDWMLYKKREEIKKTAEEIEREEKAAKRAEKHKMLSETHRRFIGLIEEFCKKYTGKKSDVGMILSAYLKENLDEYIKIRQDNISEIFGFDRLIGNKEFKKLCEEYPQKVLLVMYFCSLYEEYNARPFDYYCKFEKSKSMCNFYELLEQLGYPVSDEERQFYFDGTFEGFEGVEE
ncbi:MAG: ParB/RepB/Spo0J family partition protein [Acutalibacteraceae bacterium]